MADITITNQRVSLVYKSPADSRRINERFADIRPTGIYKGGYLKKEGSFWYLTNFICEIADSTESWSAFNKHQVRVISGVNSDDYSSTDTDWINGTAPLGPLVAGTFVLLSWTYKTSAIAEVIVKTTTKFSEIRENELIVGKIIAYDGGIDYAIYSANIGETVVGESWHRSIPDLPEFKLKVVPDWNENRQVWVLPGKFLNDERDIDVYMQMLSLPEHDRDYIIYLNPEERIIGDGWEPRRALAAVKEDPVVSATTPYAGKILLAEVHTPADPATAISEYDIKDIRGIYSPTVSRKYVNDAVAAVNTLVDNLTNTVSNIVTPAVPASAGWVKLGNGLIMKFGITDVAVAGEGTQIITFPTTAGIPPFTSDPISVQVSLQVTAPDGVRDDRGLQISSCNTTTLTVRKQHYGSANFKTSDKIHWMVIGY